MEEVRIQFSSAYCAIETELPSNVNEDLYNTLAYHPNGYFFSEKYQNFIQGTAINKEAIENGGNPVVDLDDFRKYWDGYNRFYQPKRRKFNVGLLERVKELLLMKYGYNVIIDGMPDSKPFVQHTNTYTLRGYQSESISLGLIKRFGIIKSPPRSGKTIMAVAITDSEEEFPTVFFCRSIDLARQAYNVFKHYLPYSVGLVGDGKCDIGDITIMTIQSVYSAYNKKFPEKLKDREVEKDIKEKMLVKKTMIWAKTVFYDECHHSASNTSKYILDRCKHANLKIGFSATPHSDKEDDLLIENAIGPIIADISYSRLIKEGYLLRPTIYMYRLPKSDVEGTYQTIYKEEVIDNEFLNGLVVKIVKKLNDLGESVVVQTGFIKHTNNLAKAIGCISLTGKEKGEYRQEIIEKLRKKEILCIVSTLFEEGIDVPSLGYTINLAGGLSNISTLQRMRSITPDEETQKETCGIIDFIHQCKYLHKHSLTRKRLYKSEPEFEYIERDVSKKRLEEIQ